MSREGVSVPTSTIQPAGKKAAIHPSPILCPTFQTTTLFFTVAVAVHAVVAAPVGRKKRQHGVLKA
jgi:hypothetical protein